MHISAATAYSSDHTQGKKKKPLAKVVAKGEVAGRHVMVWCTSPLLKWLPFEDAMCWKLGMAWGEVIISVNGLCKG